jgi:hypothetical protein
VKVQSRALRHYVHVKGNRNYGFFDDEVLELVDVEDAEDHAWEHDQEACKRKDQEQF